MTQGNRRSTASTTKKTTPPLHAQQQQRRRGKKYALSVKGNDAIPFPHDGPMHQKLIVAAALVGGVNKDKNNNEKSRHRLQQDDEKDMSDDSTPSVSVSMCLEFLMQQEWNIPISIVGHPNEEGKQEESSTMLLSPLERLVSSLFSKLLYWQDEATATATAIAIAASNTEAPPLLRIQDQLHALQSFRSSLLQLQQQQQQQQSQAQSTKDENGKKNCSCVVVVVVPIVYRILLEFSCGCQTTLPLRRAMHATCLSLREYYYYYYHSNNNNDNATTTTTTTTTTPSSSLLLVDVEQEVLESITTATTDKNDDDDDDVWWSKPLHSLEVYVSYLSLWNDKSPKMKSQQQQKQEQPTASAQASLQPPPMDCATAVQLSLQFMRGFAASLLPTLEAYAAYNNNNNNKKQASPDTAAKPTSCTSASSTMATATADVQDAVQIAILYTTLYTLCTTGATVASFARDESDANDVGSIWMDIYGSSSGNGADDGNNTTLGWSGFFEALLACSLLATDALPSVGQAYGRAVISESESSEDWISLLLPQTVDGDSSEARTTICGLKQLHNLPRAMAVQGLAACISNRDLFSSDKNSVNTRFPLLVFLDVFASMAREAIDPEVRLVALKGLRTLTSRCRTLLGKSEKLADNVPYDAMQKVAQQVLDIVLAAWENPPTRKLASQIPALFESVVELQDQLFMITAKTSVISDGKDQRQPSVNQREDFLHEMVQRLLQQPPHRKGRYKALETLLPRAGAATLMIGPKDDTRSDSALLQDLLVGIADAGHNTGAIAELWAKLLQHLLKELEADNDNDQVIIVKVEAKKAHTRKERRRQQRQSNKQDSHKEDPQEGHPATTTRVVRRLSADWIRAWVPSLANALVQVTELKRRKQVAAFCLPRIITMVSGQSTKGTHGDSLDAAAQAFMALLEHVQNLSTTSGALSSWEIPSLERETMSDRQLWAICEIIRYAQAERLLDPSVMGLRQAAAMALPLDQLQQALVHSSPAVRLSAYQSLEAIVETYDTTGLPTAGIMLERDLWKDALPYAIKTDIREHLSSLFCCLLAFLDRLSASESQSSSVVGPKRNKPASPTLPLLYDFVVNFLLHDVFVRKAAYPGTVNAKETFALTMLECLIVFFCRDLNLVMDSKLLPKTGSVFERKRSHTEEETMAQIREEIVGCEILASLFSLLHSCWDGTRVTAFGMLSSLILLARNYNIALPDDLTAGNDSLLIDRRAVFLASSPRQRESDTGARILAFNCLSKSSFQARLKCMQSLLELLEQRIDQMRDKLAVILSDDEDLRQGRDLPLAHGLIQSLRLILESSVLLDRGDVVPRDLTQALAQMICRAMQVSLSVVADVREGELVDGMDEELAFTTAREVAGPRVRSTQGKVNPGAIGANGIFSSINRLSLDEEERRMASQRIVMGSWFLIREACGSIPSVLTAQRSDPKLDELVKEAGTLLISTLTSLKHIGAAYASHVAFQHIVKTCLVSPSLRGLPMEWTLRLCEEITSVEKVRDSTLRRSTGYALGFLSVMRAEVSLRATPRAICQLVTKNILRYSLPAREWLHTFLTTIGLKAFENDERGLFSFFAESEDMGFIESKNYEVRTRVHSLNILRQLILDAPLSQEVIPLVGDAIISAIMGYLDPAWSVRNSSTMVFAAAMLRVVDADKNAANAGKTSKKAITVTELFRSWPSLPSFLLSVLESSVNGSLFAGREEFVLPPLLPVLVLLYRVQPVAESGQDAVSHVIPFMPVVIQCLEHNHMAIRQAGALALANLVSRETNTPTSIHNVLDICERDIVPGQLRSWNRLHGSLLTMKELLKSSVGASTIMIERGFATELSELIMMPSGSPQIPPSCMAVALLILDDLNDEMLFLTCMKVIPWVASGRVRLTDTAGLPDLSIAASSIACRIAFEASMVVDKTAENLQHLSFILTCNEADVRITATKTLKKLITGRQDTITAIKNQEYLDSLTLALLGAIESEVDRDEDIGDTVGAHIPTLRRLSRCVLKVLHVGVRLSASMSERLWRLGLSLLDMEVDVGNPDLGATPLLGNAVELMAFAVEAAESPATARAKMTVPLLSTLSRLSNPSLSWKVRHSAAVALGSIGLVDTGEQGMVARRVSLNLLQDADVDVQFSASRACISRLPSLNECCVSELVLEHACLKGDQDIFSVNDLINPLLENSGLLEVRIMQIMSEVKDTAETDHSSDVLLNVSTERKIFEEEDPNPFLERALVVQLSVAAITTRTNRPETDDITSKNADRLLDAGRRILALLLQDECPDGSIGHSIIHELTRSSSIFSDLHSLLLAIVCIIYLGAGSDKTTDALGLQAIAKEIMAKRQWSVLNPCIRQVLSTLCATEKDCPTAQKQLVSCCFLLPEGGTLVPTAQLLVDENLP